MGNENDAGAATTDGDAAIHREDAGDALASAEVIARRVYEVRHLLIMGRAYAQMRAGFLDGCSKWAGFIALICATAAIADAAPPLKLAIGVIAAVAGTAEPVFGFGRRAQEWTTVAETDSDLIVALDRAVNDGVFDASDFQERYQRVKSPLEPEFQIVRRLAQNAASIETGALDEDDPELCAVTRWERLTANILPRTPGMPRRVVPTPKGPALDGENPVRADDAA